MRLIDADVLKAKQQEDADLFINDSTISGKTRRDEALNAVANIVNAPTIDPIKHGHWTDRAKSILGVPTEACSECAEWSIGFDKNYCPCCGAKMDSPCSNCQEFDCYGCEVKMGERREDGRTD